MQKILLVEPEFPFPNKSKQRANQTFKNFIPIGLLKLGAYHKSKDFTVKLVRGNQTEKELKYSKPNVIGITSLFTYWSKYVWQAVEYYRNLFPKSEIIVGGIYVTLHHQTEEFQRLAKKYNVKWHVGTHKEAEKFLPDYSLIPPVEYHLTHAMRGCIRRCAFCGTWKIEPELIYKKTDELVDEIKRIAKNKVIFLDNNFFANPYVKDNLKAISKIRINSKPIIFESQSGFDGRILAQDPELAKLLKETRFQNIRIAWDHSVKDALVIKKQIDHLIDVGYTPKDISVFMIYNFDIPYEEMLKKLDYCKKWKVQITDCRYRPLTATYDNYNSHTKKGQTKEDYYIHEQGGWTDKKVRSFRSLVRKHNIEVRYGGPYNRKMERWSAIHNTFKFFGLGRPPKMIIIENSKKWQTRIVLMNKLKNICLKNELRPPKIDYGPGPKFDFEIIKIIKKYN
jgi:hypothetical protein